MIKGAGLPFDLNHVGNAAHNSHNVAYSVT